jgi:demethylmenaquinone methyltransferase/2-methoxy-6-polyprenyl-1,4-benzoquinol methylase
MRRSRQRYYDRFASFYDRFVAIHASDQQQVARRFLAEKTETAPGDHILDICTGTGSVLLYHQDRVGQDGVVVGIDFSRGMLEVAQKKGTGHPKLFLIQADVASLPLKDGCFHAVTCSHAFYELRGETQGRCLREVARVLKKGKPFLMMEHDVPNNAFIRMLFYLRLLSMGRRKAIEILKHEKEMLGRYFGRVEKVATPSGRSKVMVCRD